MVRFLHCIREMIGIPGSGPDAPAAIAAQAPEQRATV